MKCKWIRRKKSREKGLKEESLVCFHVYQINIVRNSPILVSCPLLYLFIAYIYSCILDSWRYQKLFVSSHNTSCNAVLKSPSKPYLAPTLTLAALIFILVLTPSNPICHQPLTLAAHIFILAPSNPNPSHPQTLWCPDHAALTSYHQPPASILSGLLPRLLETIGLLHWSCLDRQLPASISSGSPAICIPHCRDW